MLRIEKIFIYPIKSMGAIECTSCELENGGPKHDREWMLVDEQGKFLTQREFPKLALFRFRLGEDFLSVAYERTAGIDIPLKRERGSEKMRVKIWDDVAEAERVGTAYDEFFSDILGAGCSLVRMPEKRNRKSLLQPFRPKKDVNFPDSQPLLIISSASVQLLSEWTGNEIPMNRFRPNIIFSGGRPFEEDHWKGFFIENKRFEMVKPCGRCVIVNIDQETAEQGKEPLATLAKRRKSGGKTLFGMYARLISPQTGVISTGEEIKAETNAIAFTS